MSDSVLELGRVVDRYTVEASLGSGGMAQVFRVRHNTLGTLHALKVLKVQNASVRERLVQEGRLQASLRHPNIVAVTDVVDVDGTPGLLMEYIDGPSLDVWLDRLSAQGQAPTLAEAERIFRGIVAGVARAHKHGLIHRDLKPGNVLLESADGVLIPKVADFGLAKILMESEGGVSKTRSGVAMGTPAYMSPEQIRDAKNVDQRTDIFALGCIFYELVVGQSPFDGPDVLSIFSALADGRYTPVEHVVPELPAHLAATIRSSLASNRDNRLSDCAAMLSMLDGDEPAARQSGEASQARARHAVASASVGPARSIRPVSGSHGSDAAADRSGGQAPQPGGATYAVADSLLAGASHVPAAAKNRRTAGFEAPSGERVSALSVPALAPVGDTSHPRQSARQAGARQTTLSASRSSGEPAPARSGRLPLVLGLGLLGALALGLVVVAAGAAVWSSSSTSGSPAAAPVTAEAPPPAEPGSPPATGARPGVSSKKASGSGARVLTTIKPGTVTLLGDAATTTLLAKDGSIFAPGPVPSGEYTLQASFANGKKATLAVTVVAGEPLDVTCTSGELRCEIVEN